MVVSLSDALRLSGGDFPHMLKAAFGRGRLRAARFARRARRPTSTPGIEGGGGRRARDREQYTVAMAPPAGANDRYGRGLALACRDGGAAAETVSGCGEQAAEAPAVRRGCFQIASIALTGRGAALRERGEKPRPSTDFA